MDGSGEKPGKGVPVTKETRIFQGEVRRRPPSKAQNQALLDQAPPPTAPVETQTSNNFRNPGALVLDSKPHHTRLFSCRSCKTTLQSLLPILQGKKKTEGRRRSDLKIRCPRYAGLFGTFNTKEQIMSKLCWPMATVTRWAEEKRERSTVCLPFRGRGNPLPRPRTGSSSRQTPRLRTTTPHTCAPTCGFCIPIRWRAISGSRVE
ncbi:hypothetical protein B0H66DRAFT_66167 [Apodospora peruviana]|uniref:Uncharacterized protein n=1 Tax=Apodospora peruviana TaxID=516989 RepID=A0AAE0ISZ9_9PEZI|nr:hypothetical protein B0H66DRAFT_66167 [Apodospora peruviana]